MHQDTFSTPDQAHDRDIGDLDEIPALDELEMVNLTKLAWSQPLVASIRLYLSLHALPVSLPVHAGGERVEGALYTDDELKNIIDSAIIEEDAPAEEPTERDESAEDDEPAIEEPEPEPVEPQIFTLRWDNETFDLSSFAILPEQQVFTDTLAEELGSRSRAGAILAVLLTELGWPVKKISQALQVSRPTLNKWVMIHANASLSSEEYRTLVEQLQERGLSDAPFGLSIIDVRTELLRTKRSGLTWQKTAFLPSEEIADIVRALWTVSVRVRGEKSSIDSRMCSHALDMFIDILMRRGVTAQNLGRIVGVTHAAVLHRWGRSPLWKKDNEYGKDYWLSQAEIGAATEGFVPSLEDDLISHNPLLEEFGTKTVTHRRPAGAHTEEILLSVHTSPSTGSSRAPLPNVYALCTTNELDGILSDPIEATSEFSQNLYALDETPTGDAVRAVRNLVSENPEIEFEPVRVSTSLLGTNFALNDLIGYLDYGGDRVDQVQMSPLTDPVVVPSLFDVDRYTYPMISDHRQWTDGVVLTEVLLVQAVGQYDRDVEREEAGRPGFGDISHHWVPAEALGAMIDLYTHDQARDRIAHLHERNRVFEEDHLRDAVDRFLPEAARQVLERWTRETDWPEDTQPTLLWECLHTPHAVVARQERPKRRTA